jgi:DNA replicative helicase MCM subunit Mcm2 (Cdc46/Mcm family)
MNKDDYGVLNNAMAEEQTKITKANIDQMLRVRTSITATSNPIHKKFTDHDTIISQLAPIPKDILDRFDVIWAMREKIDADKLEAKYMARHLNAGQTKQIWSNEEMRNYIAYCRRITPVLDKDTAKYFCDKFNKLIGKTEEEGKSQRLRGNIMRWVYAHTKFISPATEKDLTVNITIESVDFAFSLIRHSFDLLGLINQEGFVKYEELEEIPKKTEIKTFYTIKDILKELAPNYKNAIPSEELMFEIKKRIPDITEEKIDKEFTLLKKTGNLFEPRNGFYGIL